MTKYELVRNLHRRFGKNRFTKTGIEELLDAFGSEARDALARGEEVLLPGIGKLRPRQRAARKGRNPHTGKELTIPACTVIAFKPDRKLSDALKA